MLRTTSRLELAALLLAAQHIKSADPSNGRRLFAKTCAACHTLFGEGGKVGPDITGSNRRNLDYLLENIVAPSAVLGKDYRMTALAMADGRVVSGLIQKETDSAVTLRTINDTIVLPKAEIEQRQLSIDGEELGPPIDLFNHPDVITTGVLTFENIQLAAGDHKLGIEIAGAHPKAVKAYMFGLDYVRLLPAEQ